MTRSKYARHLVGYWAGLLIFALACSGWAREGGKGSSGKSRQLPQFSEVEKVVRDYFAGRPGYRKGDLLSRSDVQSVLTQLAAIGWKVADDAAIVDQVPADDSFLMLQLHTPEGLTFMRQISKYPEAYDRLDRLARLPYGEQSIRDLIRGPDGYKMIQYMTTTSGGIALGDQLSDAPLGAKFNQPTGRLYTASELLAALKKSHAAAVQSH